MDLAPRVVGRGLTVTPARATWDTGWFQQQIYARARERHERRHLAAAEAASRARRSLLQRALACELSGQLDCALTLIRRLRDLERRPASPTRG